MTIGRTLAREGLKDLELALRRLDWEGAIPQYSRVARRFYVS